MFVDGPDLVDALGEPWLLVTDMQDLKTGNKRSDLKYLFYRFFYFLIVPPGPIPTHIRRLLHSLKNPMWFTSYIRSAVYRTAVV